MMIYEIMTTKVNTISKKTTLAEVGEIFIGEHCHHLLVTENDKLIGIISDRDVGRETSPYMETDMQHTMDEEWNNRCVEEFMITNLITIDRDTDVDCASILLLENNISALPITKNEKAVGIVTWKDLLQYYVYASGK